MTGGEAANSSMVLSRLGVRVKLDGNWLGDDDGGKRTKAILEDHQIDTSRLPLRKDYTGVEELVFAAKGTRTIFGTYVRLLNDRHWNMPQVDDVAQARVICLDPFFGKASSRVAEIGHSAGVPVVTVDCRYDDPLLKHASAVVIAESFVRENFAKRSLEELFRSYQRHADGLVIFTFGDTAIWYGRPGSTAKTFQPYSINAIDTSGAGDSFRAGLVYGFLEGWDDHQMIDFASAVAAMVCTRFPGVFNAPSLDEVLNYMREYRKSDD
jgi:sugar/nucleoside kinase (ribokinase family)